MSYNRPASAPRRGLASLPPRPWAPGEMTRRAEKPLPMARRYELSWLDDAGVTRSRVEIAPALPVFEDAFSAFTHGVLIHTDAGEVPVEDLEPGATLTCPNGATARLMWKGAITLVPGAGDSDARSGHLYRVTADAFGPGRPSRDVLFGPSARRLVRGNNVLSRAGTEAALASLADAVDGSAVIEVYPVQPMRLYHLVTDGHATILAGGLEVETFHPDRDMGLSLSSEMAKAFAALFPHMDAGGFGRQLWPRLPDLMPEAV